MMYRYQTLFEFTVLMSPNKIQGTYCFGLLVWRWVCRFALFHRLLCFIIAKLIKGVAPRKEKISFDFLSYSQLLVSRQRVLMTWLLLYSYLIWYTFKWDDPWLFSGHMVTFLLFSLTVIRSTRRKDRWHLFIWRSHGCGSRSSLKHQKKKINVFFVHSRVKSISSLLNFTTFS